MPDHLELYQLVEEILSEHGVLKSIEMYLQRPIKIIDINPQISDVTDSFWRHIFPDLPDTNTQTSYYHRDASGGDIK